MDLEEAIESANVVVAAYSLEAYRTTEFPHNGMVDLLADLMHYCERNNIPFQEHLQIAERHYTSERNTKQAEKPNTGAKPS